LFFNAFRASIKIGIPQTAVAEASKIIFIAPTENGIKDAAISTAPITVIGTDNLSFSLCE
jgi:hypothetical protein